MSAAASLRRRLALVVLSLVGALPLVRPALGWALVARGDALLLAHDPRAQAKYRLALTIDPANEVAADRYVFTAFLSRDIARLDDAVSFAQAVLVGHPRDAVLRMDRALCLQLQGRYADAEREFALAGMQRGDVQALALAAADARRLGNLRDARRLLRAAYRIDPHYRPVRSALARVAP